MKRIKYLLFTLIVLFIGVPVVKAAPSASFYTSSATIENGKSVTASVTIKNVAAWNLKIVGAGNTNGCTNSFSDVTANGGNTTKTFSVTCTANSIGAIGFTFSGDATSSDGTTIKLSGSKRVSVVQPRPASQNNYLASLEIANYVLNPSFNEEVLEYTVKVPSTVNEVELKAAVKDKYASLDGVGTFEVNEGANELVVVVTAESGAKREYKVNVVVEDPNPIIVNAEGKDYTVVKNLKNIENPNLFTQSTTIINGVEVPSFISDTCSLVLVAVKDENGKIEFLIINDDGTYDLYKVVTIGNVVFYLKGLEGDFKNYEKDLLTIGNYEVIAYKYTKQDNYYLVYGMNVSTNSEGWYKYDTLEGTLQKYENDNEVELQKTVKEYLMIIIIFGGSLLLSIIVTIISFVVSNKKIKKYSLLLAAKKVEDFRESNQKIAIENNDLSKVNKKQKKENNKKNKKTNKENAILLEETKEIKTVEDVKESEAVKQSVETEEASKKGKKEKKNKKSKEATNQK